MTTNTQYGFGQEENPTTWIQVNHGKLTVKAEEGAEGATPREYTNKDNELKTVWEYQSPSFVGNIVGATFEETKWGIMFNVLLSTPDKEYALRMQAPGRIFEQFAKRIPNIDINKPLYVGAFLNEKGGNVLYLKQDGKVEMAFTRDNPNGLPAPIQGTKMGKPTWDFSAQEEFLYQLALKWSQSFDGVSPAESQAPFVPEDEPTIDDIATDDNPF